MMWDDAGEDYASVFGHAPAVDLRTFSAGVFAHHLK
jgi:hypothetical protein